MSAPAAMRTRGLLPALLLLGACAAPRAAAPRLETAAQRGGPLEPLDWAALEEEAATALQAWLRVPAVNPPGDEAAAAAWLVARLRAEGLEAGTEEVTPGRPSVLARLGPRGPAPAVLLVSHLDVVPVDEGAGWRHPPFAGERAEGAVWGRGALDDRGPALMQAFALVALARAGVRLDREVVLLCVADEEAGGREGLQGLLERHPELRGAEVALVADGPTGVTLDGQAVQPLGVAEKSSLPVRVVLDGKGGHASVPGPDQPLLRLAAAMQRLAAAPRPALRTPELEAMLDRLGTQRGGLQGWMMSHASWPLVWDLVLGNLQKDPALAAMTRTTVAWTGLHAGRKYNVIPAHAEALLDVRVLPGEEPGEVLAWLQREAGLPEARFEVLEQQRPSRSPLDGRWPRLVEAVVGRRWPDRLVVPMLVFSASDARHLRVAGVPSYLLTPALVPREVLETVHGVDERIPVRALGEGVRAYAELLLAGAAAPP